MKHTRKVQSQILLYIHLTPGSRHVTSLRPDAITKPDENARIHVAGVECLWWRSWYAGLYDT